MTRILVIGDSHAHPSVNNKRYTTLGRLIKSVGPDIVVDIGDSADMPSLLHWDKPKPTAIFEGFDSLQADVDAYKDAQDKLMNELAKMKTKPRLLKVQGNHEERLQRIVDNEPRLRNIAGPEILCEKDYGWAVTPHGRVLQAGRAGFCHSLPGGSSKTGPRGVVTAKPGTSGVYFYGHTHRRGVHYYQGLKPNQGCIINVGCYFDVHSKSHSWAGDDVEGWVAGIQLAEIDSRGRLRGEQWFDYQWIQENFK